MLRGRIFRGVGLPMKPTSLRVLMNGLTSSYVPDIPVDTVVTDSRQVTPGSVFVAIVGDNFDGNDYARQALDSGAAAAVVSRGSGEGMILVEDTKDALCAMAGNYRDQFKPLVVGVTGSVGKTTTKEMVAAIFSSFDRNTLKNFENRNNEIGLPETVFRMDDDTRLAILEMGMSSLGEISRLSRCGKPHAAIITYIGVSHIEMLGSRENILKAKLEITDGMDKDGFLVINGDDPYLTGAVDRIPVPVVTFGVEDGDYDVAARYTVYSNMMLTKTKALIEKKNSELVEIQSENVYLDYQIESMVSMKTAEEFAENELGLVRLSPAQIEYVNLENTNKIVEEETETLQLNVATFLSTVMQLFEN